MTLPSTGIISHDMIRNEMGGLDPIELSFYYGAAPDLPTSGQISNSDFYGITNVFQTVITIGKMVHNTVTGRKGFGLADKTAFLHPEAGQSFAAFGSASVTKYILGGFDLYGLHAGVGTPYTTGKWVVVTGSNPFGRSGAWDIMRGRRTTDTEWITVNREQFFTAYGSNIHGYGYILFNVKTPYDDDPVNQFHSLLWKTPVGQQIEVEFI
jgi:hypothetical protein